MKGKDSFYSKYVKRLLDIICSLSVLTVFSPLFFILIIVGAVAMKGSPFFTQERPGKNEKIFKLIKFRTMTNAKDSNGNLLSDEERLNGYGKFLRSTSLDELPELLNIIKGDMAVVGPRPLLVRYLPRYNEEQRKRHNVKPGLTGWAQVNGRNALTWEKKFELDVWYTENVSFLLDLKILFKTVICVLKHQGISGEGSATMTEFMGTEK